MRTDEYKGSYSRFIKWWILLFGVSFFVIVLSNIWATLLFGVLFLKKIIIMYTERPENSVYKIDGW